MADLIDIDAAVIGAGPAGLIAAEQLAQAGARVAVFDGMAAPARKFLLAGRGGLNLTHSEALPDFLARYGAAQPRLSPAIEAFGPQQLRAWADDLGQSTFVGTSGRVFPVAMKASPLLRAWLRRLDAQGVQLRLKHRWTGWDGEGHLSFDTPDGPRRIAARTTVLALGGASWPRLGSDGSWADLLARKGVTIEPLKPANCGFVAAWSALFADKYQGAPLKNVALSFGPRTVRGEAMITRDGIEGGAIYALSALLRDAILAGGEARLWIALRPDLTPNDLAARLAKPKGKQSLSTYLRKAAGLLPASIGLLQEVAHASGATLAMLPADELAALINAVPVRLIGVAPIARAISTAGGIAWDEIGDDYMLRKLPGVFAAGEMLDWEAPTGGYLLTACFATGAAAGQGAAKYLGR
ncbi:aminoacetone oxidase family FAD-binding enzyme [Rhodopseudomonas palustris]|uniref:Aminoacetone oxidase family FAD-binding enzyme n=1 Tax=Rhodopseudomonas palustris TaxID=1076 RepID=A0A323UK93_RHOPL|nr:TIGR03862 family flavoprotein [Rhodopseudomonas palustris]PZA12924.1 aminoacetone oxidase family FAD-binding enzyme [Rhodopseudomonas palustris]